MKIMVKVLEEQEHGTEENIIFLWLYRIMNEVFVFPRSMYIKHWIIFVLFFKLVIISFQFDFFSFV